jgi:Cd2+/Zn2+-exporting ATPase
MEKYILNNLDCADCALKIERHLQASPEINVARVNFATATLTIDSTDREWITRRIQEVEPEVKLVHLQTDNSHELAESKLSQLRTPMRILLSILLFLIGLLYHDELHATPYQMGEWLVMVPAYLLSGYPVLLGALRNIRRRQIFDEHFLMTVATLGAWAIHEVPEAVGVMIFYMVGEYLQELSVNRSRRSIKSLLAIQPENASRLLGSQVETIPVEQVQPGDILLIRPGERVPVDGLILEGSSQVDTSALTGEYTPRRLGQGDEILAGMILQDEMLRVRATRPAAESSIARILDLVENAALRKAPTERFITRFARYYTPLVVGLAAGIAILPPIFLPGATFNEWLYRALVVLVISCPCALVVSIPLGYFGGVGAASRNGILVKGSNYLDVLAGVKSVVFDKTGTLTKGEFKVTQVKPVESGNPQELLALAMQAELYSTHPIARSIRQAGELQGIHVSQEGLTRFTEIPGQGIITHSNGDILLAGNETMLHERDVPHPECEIPGTIVHVARNGDYAGYLRIDDELKSDAPQAIQGLRKVGVDRIWMLTGDQPEKAALIATNLELDGYKAGLLPEDKVNALEELILHEKPRRGRLAFVGDGINDAPGLARADVGIAMGALGSQAAIETADVVIMSDAPSRLVDAIRIGRKTRRIVWQNIVLALGIKVLFIILGIGGEASMWEAVFADMGVALLAILNAVRIFR